MLNDMNWIEFREHIIKNDMIIFPIGSVEQHGAHASLGTDYMIAESCAKEIGKRLDAIVSPVLPIGNASGFMKFAGTVNLDIEILRDLIEKERFYL